MIFSYEFSNLTRVDPGENPSKRASQTFDKLAFAQRLLGGSQAAMDAEVAATTRLESSSKTNTRPL